MPCGPIGWGCRIHWLLLCRGIRIPQQVPCGPYRLGLQNTLTASLQRDKNSPASAMWPYRLGLKNTLTTSLQRDKNSPASAMWPYRLGLQNTLTASLQRDKNPPTSAMWPYRLGLQNTLTTSLQRDKNPPAMPCGSVGWGCRIHWLLLCRGIRIPQQCHVALSAGAAVYTDYISAEG